MKHYSIYTKLPLLSILFFLASCASKKPDSKNTSAPTQALPVDVQVVKEQTQTQKEVVIGSLLSNKTVQIASELSRKIVKVLFRDGSNVRQGQPLYLLDDADIRAKIREAQAELHLAETTEGRFKELLKTDAVRHEEYDFALAKKLALQARLDQLTIEQRKTVIRAPFEGTVGISKVFAGALVSPGVEMVDLHQQSQLKVSFSVPEQHMAQLRPGTKISFSTSIGTDTLQATVVSIDASVDAESRNVIVQAVASNAKSKLKAGMSVKVYFSVVGTAKGYLAVPTESLIPGASGFSVFVVRNGQAKIQPIEIVNRNEREAIISEGITHGDTVMTSNLMRASDGVPVSIVNIN